jgi:hypothetical protein
MKTKRRLVQPSDIIAMNEAYLKIGTYAGAGRATGWSGSTVKRYIIPDYKPKAEREPIEKIEFVIPPADTLKYPDSWSSFLTLSEEEIKGIKELQKTISI